ncbi:MAG: M23 family metallopeptidase [Phycisphaerales bacterium]|nr:M23 family metallopeptidase [Phycisphaerales bacterium]
MRVAALALALVAGACTTPERRDPEPPADHPCPEQALPPVAPSLWLDAVDEEVPVPLTLALPLPDGLTVEVTQGNHGTISHTADQAFAYDFGVPLGTAVLAAAPGVVVWVEDGHTEHGADASYRELVNYVVLDHGGGLFTAYVHLGAGGIDVVAGDVVVSGQRLAVTGLSGQMTGPHLHFHVENVWAETLPARFVDVARGGCALFPQTGDQVTGDARAFAPLVGRDDTSPIPADTWAEDEVVDVAGLPGRLYESDTSFTVTGRVTLAGATEVVMLWLPPDGGTALAVKVFPVAGDTFTGTLEAGRIDPGVYGVALVAGTGGAVEVPRSVLTTVVR